MAGRSSRRNDRGLAEDGFFNPKSIAVIGASSHKGKVGHSVLANLLDSGYPGQIYPVNPKGGKIQGLDCYMDVGSLPVAAELAVIIVPASGVGEVVSECAEKKIPNGIVISAGFREVGVEGRRLERDMVDRARRGGMRLLGPNCLGIINTSLPLNASFSSLMPPKGSIGIISQSGAMCTFFIDWARDEEIGFSKLVSLGNSADLVESDFIHALSHDDETSVISAYIEGVSNGERFFKVLAEATARKPVVLYKAGTTQAGARAASSHTGALAGSEKAYIAACEQSSAMRATSVEELVNLSRSLATQRVPRGPGLAIVTNAGGPGIIASDACEKAGLALARLSPASLEILREKLPPAASLHNPVDLLGDATPSRYGLAVRTLLDDPGVDCLVIILTPQAMTDPERTAEEIVESSSGTEKTVVCCLMGEESVGGAISRVQSAGLPNIGYPDTAVSIIARMFERSLVEKRSPSHPFEYKVDSNRVNRIFSHCARKDRRQVEPEECREVLTAYGIECSAFRVAANPEEAFQFAEDMGYPVALKVVSPQILHKTDIGGVVLGINGRDELEEAYDDISYRVRKRMPDADIEGMGVQKMAQQGRELIIGMSKDPQFGPLVMVGLGGIYVEAFDDVAFRLAPVTPADAAEMLRELKAFRLLKGVRGEKPSDVEAVEDALMKISQLALDHPELTEMDINPLMVYNAGGGCTSVDVRMTLGG